MWVERIVTGDIVYFTSKFVQAQGAYELPKELISSRLIRELCA